LLVPAKHFGGSFCEVLPDAPPEIRDVQAVARTNGLQRPLLNEPLSDIAKAKLSQRKN